MRKTQKSTSAVTALLALCALVMTGITIRHEFFMRPTAQEVALPTSVGNWDLLSSGGHVIGDQSAPVTIVEFADFQCSYCRSFALGALRAVRSQFGKNVKVVFRHWPLPYHHLAYSAARAAECAASQGRFEAYHDLLFEHQDSLGIIAFGDLARRAGVKDSGAFQVCMSNPAPVDVIEKDIAAAKMAGGTGTPTILVGGLLLHELPDSARLTELVRDAIARSGKRAAADEGRIPTGGDR